MTGRADRWSLLAVLLFGVFCVVGYWALFVKVTAAGAATGPALVTSAPAVPTCTVSLANYTEGASATSAGAAMESWIYFGTSWLKTRTSPVTSGDVSCTGTRAGEAGFMVWVPGTGASGYAVVAESAGVVNGTALPTGPLGDFDTMTLPSGGPTTATNGASSALGPEEIVVYDFTTQAAFDSANGLPSGSVGGWFDASDHLNAWPVAAGYGGTTASGFPLGVATTGFEALGVGIVLGCIVGLLTRLWR